MNLRAMKNVLLTVCQEKGLTTKDTEDFLCKFNKICSRFGAEKIVIHTAMKQHRDELWTAKRYKILHLRQNTSQDVRSYMTRRRQEEQQLHDRIAQLLTERETLSFKRDLTAEAFRCMRTRFDEEISELTQDIRKLRQEKETFRQSCHDVMEAEIIAIESKFNNELNALKEDGERQIVKLEQDSIKEAEDLIEEAEMRIPAFNIP